MSLALAVPTALAAAACYGAASAVQAVEARAVSDSLPGAGSPGSGMLGLLRRPRWLLGVFVEVVGLALHVLALTLGPASLVQPLQVAGLLLALPLTRRLGPASVRAAAPAPNIRRLLHGEAVPALVLVCGLGLFLARTRPVDATRSLGLVGIVGLLAGGAAVQLFLVLVTRRATGARRPVLLSASAGAAFAITSVLIASLARERRAQGWIVLTSWHGVVLIVGAVALGVGSLFVSQLAFQSGPVTRSLPTITVIDPVVSVVLGGSLLGETPRLSFLDVVLDVVALAGVAVSVWALARISEPTFMTGSDLPATVARAPRRQRRPRRSTVRHIAVLAAVGTAYGLGFSVIAAAVDGQLDHDDGLRTRLTILLISVLIASIGNVVLGRSLSRAVNQTGSGTVSPP